MNITVIRSRAIDETVHKLVKVLAEGGHTVTLLVWDRQRNFSIGDRDGYRTCRFTVRAPYDSLKALLYLPLWWAYELFFLLRTKAQVVHACDFDTCPPAIVAKAMRRFKLCYHIYDFYAYNLPDGFPQPARRLIRRLISAAERYSIRFAEVLFMADEGRLPELKGARIRKMVYIYNSAPDYYEKNNQVEQGDRPLVIFYAGLLSQPRGVPHMVRAVEGLDGVRLLIGGSGSAKGLVEEAARRSPNIQYIGWLPSYDEVLRRTFQADVLFRFSDPAFPNTKYESPNKVFEAMMCGKPIIVTDGSLMSKTVLREQCGLSVPYGDVEALRVTLLRLKEDPQLCRQLGENGRRAYKERYSWSIMKDRLLTAYRELESM